MADVDFVAKQMITKHDNPYQLYDISTFDSFADIITHHRDHALAIYLRIKSKRPGVASALRHLFREATSCTIS
jgi:hypothetical protein